MSDDELLTRWRALFDRPTEGWDFSSFGSALQTDEPPWDYADLARDALAGAQRGLDLGTGGGEVLSGLASSLPPTMVATEGWEPNIEVARAALAPLGVDVVPYDSESDPRLPFDDASFDVVINRHESYVAEEVRRVLRPGGVYLTQQVDGRNFSELQAIFGGRSAYPHINLPELSAEARAAGLEIAQTWEWAGATRLADVDTLVSYARMVPWEVPEDFGVDRYATELLDLHHSGRELAFPYRLFALRCRA